MSSSSCSVAMTSLSSALMSKLRMDVGSMVAPGDRIGNARYLSSGSGTYVQSGNVYASVVGKLSVHNTKKEEEEGQTTIQVSVEMMEDKNKEPTLATLKIGQIVFGKILRLTHQQAIFDIVAVQQHSSTDDNDDDNDKSIVVLKNQNYHNSGSGIIRKEDVRSGVTGTPIAMYDSFRPGDVIIAKLLSFGDSKRYLFTTAEPQLGVLYATSSKSGHSMIPISKNEMQCPITKTKEHRKCAKPPTNTNKQPSS